MKRVVYSTTECRGQGHEKEEAQAGAFLQHQTPHTAEETDAALVDIEHKWRIYSDAGCDGNCAKGV